VITATLGSVALAAGSATTLDVAGDGLLNVTVSQGAVNALAQNGGMIRADGGQVLLTARSAGALLQSAVNNTGVIQAQSIQNHNGTIRLMADMQSGTVNIGGTLDASGAAAGQTGGSITATGHHVGLAGANINASGDAGGGTVLLGGGWQGQDARVANAAALHMSADSSITADAFNRGDGGTIVLWSDGSTRAYGSLNARGGALSGNGGMIETSGHYLDVAGARVNTSAANGIYGNWLLDPADVTITGAASDPAFSGGNPNVFAPGPGVSAANVQVADITTALLTTSVTINTVNNGAAGVGAGDITIGTPIVAAPITWTAPTTLTLNAVRNVTVNLGSDITATNGSLVINSGGNIVSNAATTTTTGSLSFIAAGNLALNGATTVTTGTITAVAGGTTDVNAAMTVTTGDMVLRGDNDGTGPGAVIGGTVNVNCGINCLTITTGNLRIRFNPASYATTGAEITAYGTSLTGGGILDAKAWVFGQGDNKVYDGTRIANVSGLKPDIGGVAPAAVLGAVTNALFDTKHVGVSKLITYDSTFANAVFDLFAPLGTPAGSFTTRADITVRPLTVAAVTDTRVYNGTTSSVGVPTVTGLQVGDAPIDTLNGALTQAYVSKDVMGLLGSTLVATGGPYTVNDGNGGNNYVVTVNTAPGTITPLALVGSITAANKAYDGNNTATIVTRTLAAPIGGDTVSYVGGTALFSDKDVAVGKTVSGTGLSLAGADAANYTVNAAANTTANITPVPLTIRADDATKVFGTIFTPGTTAFTVPVPPIPGETVASVTLTSPVGTPATAPVPGPHAITPSAPLVNGAFLPTNYTITFVDGALTVTPLPAPPVPPRTPTETTPIESMPIESLPIASLPGVTGGETSGLGLSVLDGGVRTPPTLLADTTPVPLPPAPQLSGFVPPPAVAPPPPVQQVQPVQPVQPPVIVPVPAPPVLYVPPQRPRKQDRN